MKSLKGSPGDELWPSGEEDDERGALGGQKPKSGKTLTIPDCVSKSGHGYSDDGVECQVCKRGVGGWGGGAIDSPTGTPKTSPGTGDTGPIYNR